MTLSSYLSYISISRSIVAVWRLVLFENAYAIVAIFACEHALLYFKKYNAVSLISSHVSILKFINDDLEYMQTSNIPNFS